MANNKARTSLKKPSQSRAQALTADPDFAKEEAPMAASRKTNGRPKSEVAATPTTPTISERLKEQFREDDRVNAVIKQRLSQRAKTEALIADQVEATFADFKPSRLTDAERDSHNYLRSREYFSEALETVARKGAESLETGDDYRALTLNVKNTEALIDRTTAEGDIVGTVAVPALLNILMQKLATPPTLRNDPAVTICKAIETAEKALQAIEGKQPQPSNPPAQNSKTVMDDKEPGQPEDFVKDPGQSEDFVSEHVHAVMRTASSPEERLMVNIERRATQDDAALGAFKFQLRDGASDVTSYHDFNSLQIAFEHV